MLMTITYIYHYFFKNPHSHKQEFSKNLWTAEGGVLHMTSRKVNGDVEVAFFDSGGGCQRIL